MKDKELRDFLEKMTIFDNTILSTYCECPRKLYWFLRGVRPEIDPPYFAFGRAWGSALGIWHNNKDLEPRVRKNLTIDAARKFWDKENPTESGDNSLANLIQMIELYSEIYSTPEQWEVVANEIGFCVDFPGSTFQYAGALDAEISWEPYGILAREDKTTGQWIGKSLLKQWDYSTQVTGYQWALQEILGKEVFGILMNYASKKNRKEQELRFTRDLVKRSNIDIYNWVDETRQIMFAIVKEIENWNWRRSGMRNPMNCAGGPGKSSCTYSILCKDQRMFTQLEPEGFPGIKVIEELWKPWERLGED